MKKIFVTMLLIVTIIIGSQINVHAELVVPDMEAEPYCIVFVSKSNPNEGKMLRSSGDFPVTVYPGQHDNFIIGQSYVSQLKLYTTTNGGGQWLYQYGTSSASINRNDWEIVYTSVDIYDNEGNIWMRAPYITYYVNDTISFFEESDISELMELEKKFEQNLKMQFFIRTVKITNTNSVDWYNVCDLITEKAPTGNGAIAIGIEVNEPLEFIRINIAQSSNACIQDPAARYMHDFFSEMSYAEDVTAKKFITVMNNIYQDLLVQDNWEVREFGNYVDNPISSNYILKETKLELNTTGIYQDNNYVADGKVLKFIYRGTPEEPEPIEEIPEPEEPTGEEINPPAPPEGEDPTGGNAGLLAALWAVIKALFGLIASFFKMISNVIEKAFTFKNAEASSDLFNEEMILGIQFFKNVEIPQLNMTLINVFEAAFAAVGLFVLVRIGQKVLSLFNKG